MRILAFFTCFVLFIGFALAACKANNDPMPILELSSSANTTGQIFEGRYESGANMSSFVPCGMDATPGPGQGYWLVPDDEFLQVYEDTQLAMLGAYAGTYGPDDELAIFVRFEGNLSPLADAESGVGYGYQQLYQRQVNVTQMLEAKYYLLPYTPCDD